MRYPFRKYDIFDPRKQMTMRAPDDPLAYEDDGPAVARSPTLGHRIADYFAAATEGDAAERARAMNAVIDVNRADHAISGIPVYAHAPLPSDFVAQLLEPVLELPTERRSSAVQSIVAGAASDRQPIVRAQLNDGLRSLLAATDAMEPEAQRSSDLHVDAVSDDRPIKSLFASDLGFEGALEGDVEPVAYATGSQQPSPQPRQKRIVKPYRRYASPGSSGTSDPEMREADAVAQDADVTIRKLTGRVFGNVQIERSSDPYLREFARAVRRYYAEDGDRAVVAVEPLLKGQAFDSEDQYASYSSWDDRIYFTRLNKNLSNEEKIVTVIHEVLHATQTMKKLAAQVGYDKAPKGSIVRAQHEAYVDNVAKAIAKKLGLIPQNYPATDWRRYRKS